jgi:hypothetical protein
MPHDGGMRSPLLDAVLAVGVITVALTEGLSLVRGLDRVTVIAAWTVVALAFVALRGRRGWRWPQIDWRVAPILGVTALIAVVSPPNGWDAVSYHMSRVVYWIQNGSVTHFPTHNLRQVIFSPFAEFGILQLQLLWGGDRLANLVQWGAFAGCLYAITELVRRCGGTRAAVGAALVFAATLPVGIVQASGTENDLVLALWWLIAILAVEENLRTGTLASALKVGAAAGLLALTKGTGYVLGAPLLVGWAALLLARSASRVRTLGLLACAGLLALGLNVGHYGRNLAVFGYPLGERALVDYHRSELHSARALASNIARNTSLHLATPIPGWNDGIVRGVTAFHRWIGLDVSDLRTTFMGAPLRLEMSLHEDKTGNLLHLLAIVVVLGAAATRRVRLPSGALACAGLAVLGFVLLSWLLKWQPWGTRFQASVFLLMAVPCGIAAAQVLSPRALRWASAVFLVACLPWLLANESRQVISLPSHQQHNIFLNPRTRLYMSYPLDEVLRNAGRKPRGWAWASYDGGVAALERSGCRDVGLIQGIDSWDYPIWAMARERGFDVRMRQIQVENQTRTLPLGPLDGLCAVIVLDSPLELPVPKVDPALVAREIYRDTPVTVLLTRPGGAEPPPGGAEPPRAGQSTR